MPLLDYNSKTKRQGLLPMSDENKRFLEAGHAEVQDRLAQSALFRPERYIEDMTDDEYIQIGRERVKKKEGGLLKQGVSAVARGVPALGKLTGYTIKTLDPEGGIDVVERFGQKIIDVSKGMEDIGIMRPSVAEDERFVKRGIKGGLESTVPSLAPVLAGTAAGAVAGSFVPVIGTVIGGIIGGTAATLGIHGLGVYGQKKEEYIQQGIKEETAHKAAVKQGLIEGGIETVSNIVGMLTFGWGKLASQPLKQTAKELLKTPVKTFAKNLTKNALLNEVPTEMIQGALGAKVDENIGLLPEGEWQKAAIESIIPALTMSILFGVGAQGATSLQRSNIKKQLNSENIEERVKATQDIAKNIDDKELKQAWINYVMPLIDEGVSIDINADFTQTTSKEINQVKADIKSGLMAEAIKAGDITSEMMAPTIERVATQDPKLAEQISEMFAVKETKTQRTLDAFINTLDEGMTTGEIAGQLFTPESAIAAIKDAYINKTLTDENLEQLGEKYPELKNDIISEKVNIGINQEIEDAERVRRKTEEASIKERADREAKERLRVRDDVEKDKLETKKGEREKVPVEFVGMSEQVGKPSFPIVTELDEIKSTVNYDPEKHEITVKKAEYEKAVEDEKKKPIKTVEDYKRLIAKIEEGEKKEPIKFIGTRTRQGKEVPLFEATTGRNKGYQIDYNPELHEITNLDEYEKMVAAKPVPSKPAEAKPSEALREEIKAEGIVGVAPKKLIKPIPSKIRTLRGAIKEIGGIDFLNYSGELKDLDVSTKRTISKKGAIGIDQAVDELIADGWFDKNATVASFLEELRTNPKAMLSRDRITADITTKKPHELSAEEKRLKEEMEHEPEAPPEGEYVTLNAEDLPVGKKITLLEDKTDAGWDIYEIQEKDEFSITLKDGKEITLSPLDKVQVLKKDIKKTEDIEIIDPDGTYVNREKVKTIEKDGLKATYYGTYRKDGAFKAWKTAAEIDKIKKAEGKVGLDLKQEYYGKQAKVEPTEKMKQRGLGLEVEDKAQPGLFEPVGEYIPTTKGVFKGLKVSQGFKEQIKIALDHMRSLAKTGGRFKKGMVRIKEGDWNALDEFCEEISAEIEDVPNIIFDLKDYAFDGFGLDRDSNINDQSRGIYKPLDDIRMLIKESIVEIPSIRLIHTPKDSKYEAVVSFDKKVSSTVIAKLMERFNKEPGYAGYTSGFAVPDVDGIYRGKENVGVKGVPKKRVMELFAYKKPALTDAEIESVLIEEATRLYGEDVVDSITISEINKAKGDWKEAARIKSKKEKVEDKAQRRLSEPVGEYGVEKRTEKYVPITRKEADDLYDKGVADLVAHFDVRGPETTGEEGYYMRLPVQKELRGYDKKIYPKYSKEIIDAYLQYRKRHGGTESAVSITRRAAEQRDRRLPAEVRDEKKFATKAIKPQETISRKDLREIFAPMKNVATGQDNKGNFFFRVAGRPRVTIFEVDEISGYINTSIGQMPVGSYLGNKIELKTGGAGHTADISTAWHEYEHWMESAGILTANDIKALDTAIGKTTVTEEDRATYVGDRLANWPAESNTRIKRILKKISDFMDTIWEFVTRTRTAEGVIRDISTGKILAEKKEAVEPAEAKQFATKPTPEYTEMLKRYQAAHTTPLTDEFIKKTQANTDPVTASTEETKSFFKDVRSNLSGMPSFKRFSSEVLSHRDMKWYHKALETPYVLAKKFPSMKSAVASEIKRHESRTKKMFDYYHGDLGNLQKHMQKNKGDLKAFESLIWQWEGHRFDKNEVPTDWFSTVEDKKDDDYGGLRINPEHYVEVRKFLKKQGVNDVVANGFITVRKILDDVLIEADSIMRKNNIDQTDLEEFRSYMGKTHNYFSHIREGDSYIKITDKNTKKTVYREHFWKAKERMLPEYKMASARTEKWLNDQLASGELTGKRSNYVVSPAWKVTKLPDEIFFQIPVEALSQISGEAGKGLAASRVHYEAKRLMKLEGLSEKEAHDKAYSRLTADIERHLAKAMADVLKTRGWGQHAIQRQNIPGFKKTDVFETLSGYLTGYSGFATKIQAAKEHGKTLRDMDAKKTPTAYTYTSEYVRDMLANSDKTDQVVDRLRGLFFVKYLGGVVKSGIVNLTQNAVMAGPILSQYTKFSHTKLARAMKDVRKSVIGKNAWMGKETEYKNLSKSEQKALTEMVETGAAQDLYLRELKGEIPGKGWGKYVRKVMDKSGIFMQIAEKFNRASTGLAAYRIAFNEGVSFEGNETKNNHDLSVQFAKGVVYDSHFLYGKSNLPAAFRGGDFRKIARSAYTFRSFTHNYLDIMTDLMANQGTQGLKVAGRSLMNIMMVGGLTSIPFFKALSEVIQWAQDDEDEDMLTEIRSTMSNKFMQDMVTYGLIGAAGGFDLSGSLSIEIPKNLKEIIGVPYSIYEDSMRMTASIKAGNMYRAVSETPFTPIVMRNAMRGIELYTKGQRARGGKAINVPGKREPRKITGVEAVKKAALGLQPIAVSKGYRAYQATGKMKAAIAEKKRAWADRIANATIKRDFKKVREIKQEIREWNTLARKEGKRWRLVDVTEMVEGRLTSKGLRGFPVKMRPEARKRYQTWE